MRQVVKAVTCTHVMWVSGWDYAQEASVKYSGLGESCWELGGNKEALMKVTKHQKKKKKETEHRNEAVNKRGVTKVCFVFFFPEI